MPVCVNSPRRNFKPKMDLKLSLTVAFLCIFNIAFATRTVKVTTPSILAQQGSMEWLTCQYSGTPQNLVFENEKVIWKHQAYGETGFQIISENSDFVSKDATKYENNVTALNPGIVIQLKVKNVQLGDDGKFVCELKNSQGSILSSQEVNFMVINPIQRLSLTIRKSGDPNSYENVVSTQKKNSFMKVVLDEGKYDVTCKASESNPQPKVTIKMGDSTISQGVNPVRSMMPGSQRLYQETVTVREITVNRGTIDKRIECIGVVPSTNTGQVKAEFRVSNVTTKNAMVKCKNASAILGDLDRPFSCIVTVEQGSIHCSDVVWRREGKTDETYSHTDPYVTKQGVRLDCQVSSTGDQCNNAAV
ncbi:hypothetical protein KUTeg_008436 [Tegillarca granosa]|uniref:Ig-like domain-containing protein n=1 Tax=Tegillarca granosa TaxID=220873 RepID=A0ABQ9FE03_TEGGR|nr:hypothetical protein KUTeg_008436 [Tegillarca granosa]